MKAAYDDNPSYVYVCVHARVGGVPEQEKWIGDPISFQPPAACSLMLLLTTLHTSVHPFTIKVRARLVGKGPSWQGHCG